MHASVFGCIIIFLFTSAMSFFSLQDAIISIFYLGKSKTRKKKDIGKYTFLQRICLKHIRQRMNENVRYAKTIKKLLVWRQAYILIEAISVFIIALYILGILTDTVYCIIILKTIVADVPIIAYMFLMTKHGKHGGVVWRWENR